MPVLDIIHFTDRDSGDAALVLVRVEGMTVDLTLSLESDGDLSVFFGLSELERLIQTLQHARRQLGASQPPPGE
ncbi:MAG TPA: hypothetical protein VF221_03920 [Chloroflexota bacterium]